MLKKCVIIPNKILKNDKVSNSSFKRGSMQFEDFNYTIFNPHILIDKNEADL
jgi:hypothetical protein